jgi:TRAP-type C4-dicarboxylate transport system permease small subunit
VQRIFQSKIDLAGIQIFLVVKMKRRLSIYQLIVLMIFLLVIIIAIGSIGFHYISNLEWLDAIHSAALYLAGMGPIHQIKTQNEKIFSTFYAILASIFFIAAIIFILDRVLQIEIV